MQKRAVSTLAVFVLLSGSVPLAVAAQAEQAKQADQAAATPEQDGTTISVTSDPVASQVPKEIVGANHRWLRNGLGMWDAENDRPVPRIVELSQQTGLGIVRYPGGTVANLFEWKKAIGPPAERGCQVAAGFVGEPGEPVDSVYGPDENERFVDEIGARTTIMTNGSGAPASDAADYVEYMNAEVGANPNGGKDWAQVRADNGHPEPYGVDVWEVGNEVYLGNQHYWRSPDQSIGIQQYAFGGTQRQEDQPVGTGCDHTESASRSDGTANQEFRVWYPPIAPETPVTLQVGSSPDVWQRVGDLSTAGPDEKVFELDRKTGVVRFGTGKDGQGHGKIPIPGASVRASYTSGPHPGFVDYYKAMKAVDPSISVCSAWEKPEFVELMGTEHPYDCVGPHLYTNPEKTPDAEVMHDRGISLVRDTLGELDALEDAIDQHGPSGDDRPFLEVSEYGQIAKGDNPTPEGWGGSVSTTLQFASFVIGMVERDIPLAVSSNLNRDVPTPGELFGGAPDFVDTARARMLALVSGTVGTQPVSNQITDNPVADGGYRALRVLTTRAEDDGTVRLFVLNRARGLNIQTRVDLPDTVPASGELTMHTLNGDGITSHNNTSDPDAVQVETTQQDWSGGGFDHTFAAHSVTMIEVPASGERGK